MRDREVSLDEMARSGVLVFPPQGSRGDWAVVEVDGAVFDDLQPIASSEDTGAYPSAGAALGAAYDVLTLQSEGRLPAVHEYVQESVRDFVRALEQRGYDREAAVKILLDMADRRASHPPKAPRGRNPQ